MLLWDLFGKFPGTDYESFNYDWVIGKLKELKDSVAAAKASEDAAAESAAEAAEHEEQADNSRVLASHYAFQASDSADAAAASAASIADVTDQVNENTQRINNLIVNAGDGTIPSELADIRVGANGYTWQTAGDAVRGQVDDLQDQIDELESIYRQGLNFDHISEQHTIGADGVEIANANIRVLYVNTDNEGLYMIKNVNRRSMAANSIVFFDALDNVIASGTVSYNYPDFAFLPTADTAKVAIATWNVGYTTNDGNTLTEEPFLWQIAQPTTEEGLILSTNPPFITNLYNKKYESKTLLTMSNTTTSNSAVRAQRYLPVDAGDVIDFKVNNPSGNYQSFDPLIIFYDEDFTPLSSGRYNSAPFTAPTGAAYYGFRYFVADDGNVTVERRSGTPAIKIDPNALDVIPVEDAAAYPLHVILADDVINMTFKYTASEDMTIQMRKQGGLDGDNEPTGGNQLFDFCKWFKTTNANAVITPNPDLTTPFHVNGTDWFGPYRVRAINNIDGDNTSNDHFTGGNHQYNNSGSGSTPTARTSDIVFRVDGRVVESFTGYAREVSIEWLNYIQGNNTKKADGTGREILAEHHRVVFDGQRFVVDNTIEALEDIYIYTYYGLQAQQMYSATGVTAPLYYLGSKANRKRQNRNTVTNSGDKYCRDMQYVGLTDTLLMHMDPEGLGDFANAVTDAWSAFSSAGKLYFNLINATSNEGGITLEKNDTLYFKGGYEFKPCVIHDPYE